MEAPLGPQCIPYATWTVWVCLGIIKSGISTLALVTLTRGLGFRGGVFATVLGKSSAMEA